MIIRDDLDLIEETLRHHLRQGFDAFALTDHCSSDEAALRRCVSAAGAEVIFERRTDSAFRQGHWMSALADRARTELGATWIFPLDADEFVFPVRYKSIREALHAVPPRATSLVLERFNVLPPPALFRLWRKFPHGYTARSRSSANYDGTHLVTKIAFRAAPGIQVTDGNHGARGIDVGSPVRGLLEILHVPFRSHRQWEHKVTAGSAALMANADLGPSSGRHWHEAALVAGDQALVRKRFPLLSPTGPQRVRAWARGDLVRDTRLQASLER